MYREIFMIRDHTFQEVQCCRLQNVLVEGTNFILVRLVGSIKCHDCLLGNLMQFFMDGLVIQWMELLSRLFLLPVHCTNSFSDPRITFTPSGTNKREGEILHR